MRQVTTCQGPLWVWDQDQVGAVLGGGAFWDWQLRPIMDEASSRYPERMALDVGASVGWFTIYLAQRFAHVLAVEAHPDTYLILTQNIREHQLRNAAAVHWVASDATGAYRLVSDAMIGWPIPADLNLTPNPSSIAFEPDPAGPYQGGPVDSLLDPDQPVGFIKIDVQGLDLAAIRGLRRTIERWRPWGCFEFEMGPSGWHGHTLQDYLDFWAELDYEWQELPASNYAVWPKGERRV